MRHVPQGKHVLPATVYSNTNTPPSVQHPTGEQKRLSKTVGISSNN